MQRLIVLIVLFAIAPGLIAQQTVISGKDTDYRGKIITFYSIVEPVLDQKNVMGSVTVKNDGTFTLFLPVSGTTEIYCDLEKYCGTMVVEPGKKYSVTLPPFSPRTADEAHSAYFKPAPYWLGLPRTDNNDLNYKVRSFVAEFNSETVKNTVPIYQKGSKVIADQIIEKLGQKYSDDQNTYFETLKLYSFAELEYAVHQNNPDPVIKEYFATKPVWLQHPAYQKAFGALFTDYLRKQSQDAHYRKLVNIVNSGDYIGLVQFFENRGYRKDFAELIVLKGLNDGYYSGSFSKKGIIKAIETAQTETASNSLLPVARQIKKKLTMLAVGGEAPGIGLYNAKKEMVTMDKFIGKFVYLNFINSRSHDCRMELDSLVSIEKNLRQVLQVVSIAIDDDFGHALQLWKDEGYPWELLDGSNQKELATNYNATVTPAFYLISPDGKLVLSPASSPSQEFGPIFLRLLRGYSFNQQRKPH